MPYKNPVISGFHPDPSICRVGEDYWLVTSSFEYFPGVPIFHSRDLVHWRQVGHCLTRSSQLPLAGAPASRGIYAPTIRHDGERFYMITTNVSGGGHFYVSAIDPAGEWSEPIWLRGLAGIDPSLWFDGQGAAWMQWKAKEMKHARIDLAVGRLLGEPEDFWPGMGMHSPEAPHLFQAHGMFYALLAEGGTEYGHCVTIARGPSPQGPWEACPANPILTHRSTGHPIQATGHADFVEAHDGSWWAVFLGIRPIWYPPVHHLGRETFLAPVAWEDGWPVINGGQPIALAMKAPTLPAHLWPEPPMRDDFDDGRVALPWVFLRNPNERDWSLTERPGFLRLRGSEATLDEAASPAFLGRRQQHFSCEATALLEFEPRHTGEEAGLTVLMNNRHHCECGLAWMEGERRVFVRKRLGELSVVTASRAVGAGPVRLRIEAAPLKYTFSFAAGEGSLTTLDSAETRCLATEVAGGFTGVFFGMYATGKGRPANAVADFDWFEYRQTADDPTTAPRR